MSIGWETPLSGASDCNSSLDGFDDFDFVLPIVDPPFNSYVGESLVDEEYRGKSQSDGQWSRI
jgi:hypothetical protein